MWLTVLMIAFAVAMVVGPVMMIRPTAGTSRLARLRSLASAHGMNVRLPAKTESKKRAIYSIPLSPRLRERRPIIEWHIVKKSHVHALHIFEHWDWVGDDRPGESVEAQLVEFLKGVPEGFTSFDCTAIGVACLWDEYCRGQEDETVIRGIKTMLEDLRARMEKS